MIRALALSIRAQQQLPATSSANLGSLWSWSGRGCASSSTPKAGADFVGKESDTITTAADIKVEGPSKWATFTVTPESDVAIAAFFIKKALYAHSQAALTCFTVEEMWKAYQILRLTRRWLIKEEYHVPIFQVYIVPKYKLGLSVPAGSTVLYLKKILHGTFKTATVHRVSAYSRPREMSDLVSKSVREGKGCILESLGKESSIVSLQSLAFARQQLAKDALGFSLALDPAPVPHDMNNAEQHREQTRFVVLPCAKWTGINDLLAQVEYDLDNPRSRPPPSEFRERSKQRDSSRSSSDIDNNSG